MSTVYEDAFAQAAHSLLADYKARGQEGDMALWFNMRYAGEEGAAIKVGVPSAFMWRMMEDKGLVTAMTQAVSERAGVEVVLQPVIEEGAPPVTVDSDSDRKSPSPSSVTLLDRAGAREVFPASAPVVECPPFRASVSKPPASHVAPHPTLMARYTFDTFVTGENSEYAYNVCQAAAKEPGHKFNPILLYGGVGLGKTHLMQAIGNYIYRERSGQVKIVCASAEQFGTDYTKAMRVPRSPQAIDKFKDKYRGCDVLLLDDIHFLQGKGAMQDELFYTFNALRDKNRQLVFTCDRPIAQLEKIVDRLASRISNGQCVDLRAPNYEVRRAILHKKMEAAALHLPQDVVDYIARFIETNVRDLESALNKVTGYAEMTNKACTVDLARRLLSDMKAAQESTVITIEAIQKAVAAEYGVTVAELKGKKRDKRLAHPRQVACYLCRELTESAFSDIGREFGGRDHATIMHACDVISTERTLNAETDDKITRITQSLGGKK